MRQAAVAFALAFVVCTPLPSAAQESARAEAFGGYAFARDDDRNMHGWNGALTLYVLKWLGVSADVSGQYVAVGPTDRARFAVLAGPRVSPWRGRFTPFGYGSRAHFIPDPVSSS